MPPGKASPSSSTQRFHRWRCGRHHNVGTDYERFGAYVVVSALMLLAYPQHLIRVGLAVVGPAVMLEIVQIAIPNRDARVSDALVKAAGALIGLLAAWGCNKWHYSRESPSPEISPTK